MGMKAWITNLFRSDADRLSDHTHRMNALARAGKALADVGEGDSEYHSTLAQMWAEERDQADRIARRISRS